MQKSTRVIDGKMKAISGMSEFADHSFASGEHRPREDASAGRCRWLVYHGVGSNLFGGLRGPAGKRGETMFRCTNHYSPSTLLGSNKDLHLPY